MQAETLSGGGPDTDVPPDTQAHQALRAAILKTFFYAAAAAAFIACLNYLLRPPALPAEARALLLAACAALGLGSLAGTRLNGRQAQRAMLAVAIRPCERSATTVARQTISTRYTMPGALMPVPLISADEPTTATEPSATASIARWPWRPFRRVAARLPAPSAT